ncbi:MAG TPA: TolC family protein [Desulfosalsimonadaceae bacterium]|nr:TolC family protein [Desulfosalsimonadaceae bacterium]
MENRPAQNILFGLALFGLLLGCLCPTARGQARGCLPVSAPPALAALIAEGLNNNQAIQARAAETEAARNRVAPAGALPDPRIGLAVMNLPTDSFRFDEEPMTQKQVALEQKVPWLSKLDLQSETMQQTVRLKQAELASARLSLARDIAEAYYEMGYVAKSRKINAGLMDMLRRIRRDAQNRYTVGKGLQQDIFQAEVELSRLQDEAIMLENRKQTLLDRIHALLNQDTRRPVDPPENLPSPHFALDLNRLKQTALSANPKLQALKAAAQRARTGVELAEKAYYPDFNFRLAYGQRDEDFNDRDLPDFFSAAVMMDVPLWHRSKQSKDLAAASNQLRSAENRYTDLRRRLPHQIRSLLTEADIPFSGSLLSILFSRTAPTSTGPDPGCWNI